MAPRETTPFGRRGVRRRAAASPRAAAPTPVADPREFLGPEDDETLMARFIGPDWPDYQDLWRLMRFDGALLPSFSLPALSFSFAWLLYRRLYGAGLAAMAAQIAMTRLSLFDSTLGGLLLCLFTGVFGKALVVRKGMATIARLRDDDPAQIGKMGGTRLLPAILAFIAVIVASAVELMGPLAQLVAPDGSFRPNGLAELLNTL